MIGIISELRISDDLGLCFSPGLEFVTRSLVYTNIPDSDDNKQFSYNKTVYLSLPLIFKYKAKMINPFSPFLIAGGSYKYDLQKHDNIDTENLIFFRTNRNDFFLEVGGGCDFYLPYFKYGVELHFSLGMTDVLVHQPYSEHPGHNEYTTALSKLKSRMFTVALNFE